MQKDFKIGLAIGVTLAAGAILWLATLPNLSARARALQDASDLNIKLPFVPRFQPEVYRLLLSPSPRIPRRIYHRLSTSHGRPIPKYEIRMANDETRIHIVQKGDTLSSISAKYYGSARQWRKIVAANRSNLPDPNHLVPGTKLIIP